ncbi:hypothetical protein KIN20_031105 [Parelaphostrongylus tenuis]|uniref:Uncharacterized protein n=1 Tax=Parelaphostrongylus tenuis TaxID=148309 RepID=A0AAD5R4W5_PARTN|nr:hypothetical protein KIN20_031105 [Parelaphostrongylus tenuis]
MLVSFSPALPRNSAVIYRSMRLKLQQVLFYWDIFKSLGGSREDTVFDNIDDEYDGLVEYLHVSVMKTESLKATKS